MADTPASPSYTIKIGKHEYVLDGAFQTIRAVEQRFARNIARVFTQIDEMAAHEIAELIAIGAKVPDEAHSIGEKILEHVGVLTHEYNLLKIHLMTWLNVVLSPAPDREKKRAEMQQRINEFQTINSSPGANTKD